MRRLCLRTCWLIVVCAVAAADPGSAGGQVERGDGVVRGWVTAQDGPVVGVVLLQGNSSEIRAAPVAVNGRFELHDVKDGAYVLRVTRTRYLFPDTTIQMLNGRLVRAREHGEESSLGGLTNLQNLVLKAQRDIVFVPPPPKFQLLALLRSQYTLIAITLLLAIYLFPKFIDQLDDELLQELTGQRRPAIEKPTEIFAKLRGN
mmetsp:Transcript_12030/g.36677  ORF Transcript_12030/g.36677 Transcript_12030/m.36677 type:complete len:203 (+) Transcript_12030:1072-1680(+)